MTARTNRPTVLAAVVATALAGALLAPTPFAAADDGPAALQHFEQREAAVLKECGARMWDAADAARRQGIHQRAAETAERVIGEFDPDHKAARELLGWKKKGKEWVHDPSAAASRTNTKGEKESDAAFHQKVRKWEETTLRKAEALVAVKYAQIGTECAAKGWPEQARKGWERALGADPQNAEARKGLGYDRLGDAWVTRAKADAVRRAAEGRKVEGPSRLDQALKTTLHKVATPHFRIEDDAAPEALAEAARTLETLYAYYLADVGRDPTEDVFGGRVAELCVVSTKPRWDAWVDAVSNAKDKAWTKESNTSRDLSNLVAGTLRVETAEHVDTRDPLLHHAAHFMNHVVWKCEWNAWVSEGLAYYYTVKVQETTRTHCVARTDGGYAEGAAVGGNKDWTISELWKPFLKDVVAKKNDRELRAIMGTPLATLDLAASVKAWGVVSFLMDHEREKFLAFLAGVRDRRDTKAETPEAVFEKVFARSIEQVDKEWRAYAVRAY